MAQGVDKNTEINIETNTFMVAITESLQLLATEQEEEEQVKANSNLQEEDFLVCLLKFQFVTVTQVYTLVRR